MHFLLFLWRNRHIVAIEVAEVSVGVMRSRERLALKGYCGEREKLVAAVHDAVAVVDEDVGEEGAGLASGKRQLPHQLIIHIFRAEIEQLHYGSP